MGEFETRKIEIYNERREGYEVVDGTVIPVILKKVVYPTNRKFYVSIEDIQEAKKEFPKCKECKDFEYYDGLGECTVRTPEDKECPKNKWFEKWFGE